MKLTGSSSFKISAFFPAIAFKTGFKSSEYLTNGPIPKNFENNSSVDDGQCPSTEVMPKKMYLVYYTLLFFFIKINLNNLVMVYVQIFH